MTAPLPSCARMHPGIASVITESIPRFGQGSMRAQRHCRVCKRLRNLGRRSGPAKSPGMLYGVIALSWTPPEMLQELI